MSEHGCPSCKCGQKKAAIDYGDVTTWSDSQLAKNFEWADSVNFTPLEPAYRWWVQFRTDLRDEIEAREHRKTTVPDSAK